ncbi:Urease accessory protein UreD [Rhodovulum sp. P5]|nr:Urease accessory protein UreD [Rhodovulum sp. P5]
MLATLRQSGAFKALFPNRQGAALDSILINTAGGLTGGDRFTTDAMAGQGSHLRFTTQAAERAYLAQPGEVAQVQNRLIVETGARLDWLPQETILYRGSALHRTLTVELAPGARVLLVEPVIFGRTAMGEVLSEAEFRDRIEIRQSGAPLYLDAVRLSGDVSTRLSRRGVGAGAGAMASVVFAAPEADAHLAPLRALLPDTGGVSLIRPGLLALRLLAGDGYDLRKALLPVLMRLTEDAIPRSWMT